MARPRGAYVPTRTFEKITSAVNRFNGDAFSTQDITALCGASYIAVQVFLYERAKEGRVERIARGKYRAKKKLKNARLSLGLVAEATWLVLATEPYRRPLRSPEIVEEVESLTGATKSLRKGVCVNLLAWHRSGHLERTGKYGEYAYRIKEGVTERPVLRH